MTAGRDEGLLGPLPHLSPFTLQPIETKQMQLSGKCTEVCCYTFNIAQIWTVAKHNKSATFIGLIQGFNGQFKSVLIQVLGTVMYRDP